jgi:hypothetical protein
MKEPNTFEEWLINQPEEKQALYRDHPFEAYLRIREESEEMLRAAALASDAIARAREHVSRTDGVVLVEVPERLTARQMAALRDTLDCLIGKSAKRIVVTSGVRVSVDADDDGEDHGA